MTCIVSMTASPKGARCRHWCWRPVPAIKTTRQQIMNSSNDARSRRLFLKAQETRRQDKQASHEHQQWHKLKMLVLNNLPDNPAELNQTSAVWTQEQQQESEDKHWQEDAARNTDSQQFLLASPPADNNPSATVSCSWWGGWPTSSVGATVGCSRSQKSGWEDWLMQAHCARLCVWNDTRDTNWKQCMWEWSKGRETLTSLWHESNWTDEPRAVHLGQDHKAKRPMSSEQQWCPGANRKQCIWSKDSRRCSVVVHHSLLNDEVVLCVVVCGLHWPQTEAKLTPTVWIACHEWQIACPSQQLQRRGRWVVQCLFGSNTTNSGAKPGGNCCLQRETRDRARTA